MPRRSQSRALLGHHGKVPPHLHPWHRRPTTSLALRAPCLLLPLRSRTKPRTLMAPTWAAPPAESLALLVTDLCLPWLCHCAGISNVKRGQLRRGRFERLLSFDFPPSAQSTHCHTTSHLEKQQPYINVCVCLQIYVGRDAFYGREASLIPLPSLRNNHMCFHDSTNLSRALFSAWSPAMARGFPPHTSLRPTARFISTARSSGLGR